MSGTVTLPGECEYVECRDPEHCSMGGSCETAFPAAADGPALAEVMLALADRWDERSESMRQTWAQQGETQSTFARSCWQRSVDYHRRASELRAELRP